MKRPNLPTSDCAARAIPFAFMLVVTTIVGCQTPPSEDHDPRAAGGGAFERHHAAERSRQLLLGSEIGLELREWIIEADSHQIARAMAEFRADRDHALDIIDEELAERLKRNGLRLVPVRIEDLDALERALGYASLNRRGWHGQLVEWLPLHGHQAGGRHQALFIDGRPRRFDRGEYRLMSRAWILPMENGPRMNLQIVPEFHIPRRDSLHHLLAQSEHDGPRRGEPINSITLDLLVDPEYALILTGEEPTVNWTAENTHSPGLDRESRSDEEKSNDSNDEPSNAQEAPDNDHTPLGPHAELPLTLGEMLFMVGGVRDGRGMLIFVPRVPDELLVRTE